MISKLMRLYKRSHGLRQIPNIAVYITHSACTIHLLNLPEKNAKRDIVHGIKHLEEIAEGWLCARRTLAILSVLANKWKVELPEEASSVLARTDVKFGSYIGEVSSPAAQRRPSYPMSPSSMQPQPWQTYPSGQHAGHYFGTATIPKPTLPANHASAAAASHGANYKPPPQNASGMQPQQCPSATNKPAASLRWQSADSSHTRAGGSPSDMFGGVEQLIRDSSDWAYRDQAQLATGFENWDSINMDPNTWTSPVASSSAMHMPVTAGPVAGINISQPMHNRAMTMPPTSNGVYTSNTNAPAPDGTGMANWLNSMNAYNMSATAYNEDEWYR